MSDLHALKAELRAYALGLGLDRVGVADAAPFERERAFLAQRTPNPYEHPVIAERVELDRLLPGVRSIVAVAMSYHAPDPAPGEGLHGWYSRYCRGLDYHRLMIERLHALAAWVELRLPGTRTQVHVDMGPPLDRAVAERAGLGKPGKSTLTIAPGLGTWTLLGELLLTAELPPDPPLAFSPCGSCRRCLDACPTGALTEWALDSQRCLGYLNQMEGAIPAEFRAVMGDRLFGCDDCQDVCPYNRTAATGLHPEFAPVARHAEMTDLAGLLTMTEATFREVFGPTAAEWRGLETLQRNALVALGNSGSPDALAPLTAALDHESALLREHAAWGLERLAELRGSTTPCTP